MKGLKVVAINGNEYTIEDLWKNEATVTLDSDVDMDIREYISAVLMSYRMRGTAMPDIDFIEKSKELNPDASDREIKNELISCFADFCDEYNLDATAMWGLHDAYLNGTDNGATGFMPSKGFTTWDHCVMVATEAQLAEKRYGIEELAALDTHSSIARACAAEDLKSMIYDGALDYANLANMNRDKGQKIKNGNLTMDCLASVIASTDDVRYVKKAAESDEVQLAVYHRRGSSAGMWSLVRVTDPRELGVLASCFLGKSDSATMKNLFSSLAVALSASNKILAPLAITTSWYVAVADGVVDVRKDLGKSDYIRHTVDTLPNPEYEKKFKIIYKTDRNTLTSKAYGIMHRCPGSYDPDAKDVDIVNEAGEHWSVKQQVYQTFGNDERQVNVAMGWAGRALRCEAGDTALLLMDASETAGGGGGKGTFGEMLRNASGGGFFEKKLSSMVQEFGLAGIENARGVIVGDTDSTKIDALADLKLLLTHEPISITYKHRTPFQATIDLPMLIMSNYALRLPEQDEAMYRRMTVLECPSQFASGGKARPEIMEDYAKRPEVARFFIKWALEVAGTSTCISPEDKAALEANKQRMKINASSVYDFLTQITSIGIANNEMPIDYYYDGYRAFCKRKGMQGSCNFNTFMKQLYAWMKDHPDVFEVVDMTSSGGIAYRGGILLDEWIGRWRADGVFATWINPLGRNDSNGGTDTSPAPIYTMWLRRKGQDYYKLDMTSYKEYIAEMIILHGRDVELLSFDEFVARGGALTWTRSSRTEGAREWASVGVTGSDQMEDLIRKFK